MANGVVVGGALYCRKNTNTTDGYWGQFASGSLISITAITGNSDWWKTTWTNGSTGYVMKAYVVSTGDTIQIKGTSVNVRPTVGTSGTPLYQVSNPTTSNVLDVGSASDGGWIKIQPSGKSAGWVRFDYVTKTASGSGGGDPGGGGTGVNTATWAQVKAGNGVYKKESSGSATCEGVKTLQQLLKNIGYGTNNVGNIAVDGNFGSITEDAVKKFQYECGLTQDGVVGASTATKLEAVQNDQWFTKVEYYPLKATMMTYASYPDMGSTEKTERSVVVRAISAEHGYPGSSTQGHKDARIGVAKVLRNRRTDPRTTSRGKVGDNSFKSVYLSSDYTSKNDVEAGYLPRGYSAAMQHMHDAAVAAVSGATLNGAPNVGTRHLFQKGSSMVAKNPIYKTYEGYCQYPEGVSSSFTFFHINVDW